MDNYKIGDKVVYPGHGIGEVISITDREVFGKKHMFYTVKIFDSEMKIMIPRDNIKSIGLRPIISKNEAEQVLKLIEQPAKVEIRNDHYKNCMKKLKTGNIFEIAEIVKDVNYYKMKTDLSFGELKMLDTARSLLYKELSLALIGFQK